MISIPVLVMIGDLDKALKQKRAKGEAVPELVRKTACKEVLFNERLQFTLIQWIEGFPLPVDLNE